MIIATTENKSPPMAPVANANQNTSFWPPQTNGTKPRTVEKIVNKIAVIF